MSRHGVSGVVVSTRSAVSAGSVGVAGQRCWVNGVQVEDLVFRELDGGALDGVGGVAPGVALWG